jgi:hypothetical protein
MESGTIVEGQDAEEDMPHELQLSGQKHDRAFHATDPRLFKKFRPVYLFSSPKTPERPLYSIGKICRTQTKAK